MPAVQSLRDSRTRRHRRPAAIVLASIFLVVGTGCTSSTVQRATAGGALTIGSGSASPWTCGFNPFNPSENGLVLGVVYETLVYDNLLSDNRTPWLASAYSWSQDSRVLTFTMRSNVHWTDGQPFSAADVVYTFDLIRRDPKLDLQSVWSVLARVTQEGPDRVVMTFTKPAAQAFYQVAGQVGIVPQHIWSVLKDPATAVSTNPVGTGPFTIGQCTPGNITYTRNPNYWQKGLPHLQTVNYPSFIDNDAANAYLATGQAQWGGQFIPNVDTYYVARDPSHNHFWFPPIDNVNVWINTMVPPLNNKVVRQALAYGIDRGEVSRVGEYGYEPPGNQTGVLTPTFDSWIDAEQAARYAYKFDPARVATLLRGAGYTRNSAGIFQDSAGKPLSFTAINLNGFTDWVTSMQAVEHDLQQAGIEVKVLDLPSADYYRALFTGNFQLAYGSLATAPGPTPYYELRNTLHSSTTAAIGAIAAGNYGRYSNPAVDALLDQYTATNDPAQQHMLIAEIQAVMLEDVPVIPVTEGVAWYEWTTKGFAGWPTPDDPYASPAPWNQPDWEVVLLHVYRTG
jgi:peptide/nickel transport system substrate-binding protein